MGSYDEHARVWDTRMIKMPVQDIELGGGVWRLKWHPHDSSLLLACCMHNGVKVINVNDESSKEIVHYTAHSALTYGIDWNYARCSTENFYICSCSFYNHEMHYWKFTQ